MAQTIALQRGSTGVTWDGTTLTTLFTQSGGTATRVIVGGVSAHSSVSSPLSMGMFVKQSGASVYTMVAFKSTSSGGTSFSLDFFGGSTINNPFGQRASTANMTSSSSVIAGNASATYTALQNFNGILLAGGDAANYLGGTSSNYDVCPQQFWIGSGDSVVMKFFNFNNTAATGNVGYSFTTITES